MDWNKLMTPYRLGYSIQNHNPDRSEFQKDFDRIIFSTNFRRLNGKTQVFPFPETDVIHTRMTHSLETASVGRSLGTIVGNELHRRYPTINGWQLGAVCQAACLGHDIGNPPFGHSGENAIAEYFQSPRGAEIIKDLSPEQKADFTGFEGNAMGFHILTYSNPQKTQNNGGYGLTFPTLAAFTKYPRPSIINNPRDIASEKKPGIFQSDLRHYHQIARELGTPLKEKGDRWYRYPLAFLTEAADDICYMVMDLEDGYKHGLVPYQKTYNLLHELCCSPSGQTSTNSLANIKDKKEKIGYLRAKAINSLVYQVADVFLKNEADILNGKLDKPLTVLTDSGPVLKDIKKLSKARIYSHKPVIQVIAAGFQVLPGLLDTFLYALKEQNRESSKTILKLIPEEFKFSYQDDPYSVILSITTYVAGMTDTYAVDTYRNLRGIELPNY